MTVDIEEGLRLLLAEAKDAGEAFQEDASTDGLVESLKATSAVNRWAHAYPVDTHRY